VVEIFVADSDQKGEAVAVTDKIVREARKIVANRCPRCEMLNRLYAVQLAAGLLDMPDLLTLLRPAIEKGLHTHAATA
jgi:hypothetical protein